MEPFLLRPLPFLVLSFATIAPFLPSPLASHQQPPPPPPPSPASYGTLPSSPLPSDSPPFVAQQQASSATNNSYIISSSSPNPALYSSSRFNPSMAIVIVVLLSSFFFMGFFSVYVRRCTAEDGFDLNSTSNAGRSVARNNGGGGGSSSNLMSNNPMTGRFSFGSSASDIDVEGGEVGFYQQGAPLLARPSARSGGGVDEAMVRGLPTMRFRSSAGSHSFAPPPPKPIDSCCNIAVKCSSDGVVIMVAECAVCLCDFQEGEFLRLLPRCGHFFHQDCIDTWLVSHTTCPLCRTSLLLDHFMDAKTTLNASNSVNNQSAIADTAEPASATTDADPSALMRESTASLVNRHYQFAEQPIGRPHQQTQQLLHVPAHEQHHGQHELHYGRLARQELQQQSANDGLIHHGLIAHEELQQPAAIDGFIHHGLFAHQELQQPAANNGAAGSPSSSTAVLGCLIIQDCSFAKRLQRSHSTGHSLIIREPSVMQLPKGSAKPIISTSNYSALHHSFTAVRAPSTSSPSSSSANVIQALTGSLLHRSRSYTMLRSTQTS